MPRSSRLPTVVPMLLIVLVPLAAVSARTQSPTAASHPNAITEGSLRAIRGDGVPIPLPLRHTDVQAEISGFVSRVQVVQTFHNPFEAPIEAVYVFPLPDDAGVDGMTIRIGERVIRGEIKRRGEARQIYEQAKSRGLTAALLDQERPNIFTQSVANIAPGEAIHVTLTYVAPLAYDEGRYTFNFPMVVGPRYIPGTPLGGAPQGSGVAQDTTQVVDASRISPPLLEEGQRSGHDVSVAVKLDAGVPIRTLSSPSHDVEIVRRGMREAEIRLKAHDAIPNKDFILRYEVAGEQLQAGILTHRDDRGGFFTLMLQPQADFRPAEITPKEMFFVIDQSCSQSGLPMAKQKGIIYEALERMNPGDTFNIVTFNSGVQFFAERALPNRPEHVARARRFVEGTQANGGTEMLQGVVAALSAPRDPERLRMLLFLSDGYVGNDHEIIATVEKHIGDGRMFTYGVGSSVNHYLLSRMAEVGRGYYQYARVDEDTEASVRRFYDRIARPYLVNIEIDYGDLGVSEVYPKRVRDLFAGQPIIVTGRYGAGGRGRFTVRGQVAGRPYVEHVEVELPRGAQPANAALASMFGRARIEHLSAQQYGGEEPEIVEAITETALTFRLMSPYTSFVAVDESRRVGDGSPLQVVQPVEVPEGTLREVFVGRQRGMAFGQAAGVAPTPQMSRAAAQQPGRLRKEVAPGMPEVMAPAEPVVELSLEGAPEARAAVAADRDGGEAKAAARLNIRLREVVVRGPTPKAEVSARLERVLRAVERELRQSGMVVRGEMTLRVTVAEDGRVREVKVIHDGVGAGQVIAVLERRAKAEKWPAGGSVTVITFRLSVT